MPVSKNRKNHKEKVYKWVERKKQKRLELINQFKKEQLEKIKDVQ